MLKYVEKKLNYGGKLACPKAVQEGVVSDAKERMRSWKDAHMARLENARRNGKGNKTHI